MKKNTIKIRISFIFLNRLMYSYIKKYRVLLNECHRLIWIRIKKSTRITALY